MNPVCPYCGQPTRRNSQGKQNRTCGTPVCKAKALSEGQAQAWKRGRAKAPQQPMASTLGPLEAKEVSGLLFPQNAPTQDEALKGLSEEEQQKALAEFRVWYPFHLPWQVGLKYSKKVWRECRLLAQGVIR